jgi:4-hydroxy-4-methyl-2-oxoglutarate aldolase
MDPIFADLRHIRTPIVYDTLERLGLRANSAGYSRPGLACLLPSLGPMVGYACTGKIAAELPPAPGERQVPQPQMWRYVAAARQPSIMVVQDLDQPPARGCAWGDVAASLLLRLGCVGAVTNGGVRDIREVEALGFQLCAPAPVVGHAYIRYVELDTPVKISELIISPGDLLHADEHGLVIIPPEVPLPELVARCREFLASEKVLIDYSAQPGFNLDEAARQMEAHEQRASRLWHPQD